MYHTNKKFILFRYRYEIYSQNVFTLLLLKEEFHGEIFYNILTPITEFHFQKL